MINSDLNTRNGKKGESKIKVGLLCQSKRGTAGKHHQKCVSLEGMAGSLTGLALTGLAQKNKTVDKDQGVFILLFPWIISKSSGHFQEIW